MSRPIDSGTPGRGCVVPPSRLRAHRVCADRWTCPRQRGGWARSPRSARSRTTSPQSRLRCSVVAVRIRETRRGEGATGFLWVRCGAPRGRAHRPPERTPTARGGDSRIGRSARRAARSSECGRTPASSPRGPCPPGRHEPADLEGGDRPRCGLQRGLPHSCRPCRTREVDEDTEDVGREIRLHADRAGARACGVSYALVGLEQCLTPLSSEAI